MSIPEPVVLLDGRSRYAFPGARLQRVSVKNAFDATSRLRQVPAGALSWDHDPGTGQSRGLLVERNFSNFLLWSRQLDNSAWSKWNTEVSYFNPGPTGENDLARVRETEGNSTHYVAQTVNIDAGRTYTFSMVAQYRSRRMIALSCLEAGNNQNYARVLFDLVDGAVVRTETAQDAVLENAGIEDLGGGFYRPWIAVRLAPSITQMTVRLHLVDGAGELSYPGDASLGTYAGYMQLERYSLPTSILHTEGASVTRSADRLVVEDASQYPWWRADEGTVAVEFYLPGIERDYVSYLASVGESLYIAISEGGHVSLGGALTSSGWRPLLLGSESPGWHRAAFAWGGGEAEGAINGKGGSEYVTTISGSPPSNSTLGLGCNGAFISSPPPVASLFRCVYYPQRLPRAALQSITASQGA